MPPLTGYSVVSLALNLPGPVAAAQVRDLGASVLKVEPPAGDPLRAADRAWYDELHAGMEIVRLDLKSDAGRAQLERRLEDTDLLLTSFRLSALERLGLAWSTLSARYPRLCQVAIVGHAEGEFAGHDLTYQAEAGLLDPPRLPRALVADFGGALMAVSAALAVLMNRDYQPGADVEGRYTEVALTDAAVFFSAPFHRGFTQRTGWLGGAVPQYGVYEASDGWIAVAALEPHFWSGLQRELGVSSPAVADLQQLFSTRSARDWERWGQEKGLPIAALRSDGSG